MRVGKRFIPPFLHQIGPLSEVSWVSHLLPELLWIGLLIDCHGYRLGVELALEFAKAAQQVFASPKRELFAWASSFDRLSQYQKAELLTLLSGSPTLEPLRLALLPLTQLYPASPFGFMHRPPAGESPRMLDGFKRTLLGLYTRTDVPATRAQATALYIAFVTDCLKTFSGSVLSDFPEIEWYPQTEKSKLVAASIRATINAVYGDRAHADPPAWPLAFWNRGLELEECHGLSELHADGDATDDSHD